MRVVMADGWREWLDDQEGAFFAEHLGPDMLADAKRSVPILTGRLERSLDVVIVDGEDGRHELQMGSFPDEEGEVPYAAAVELGFRGEEFVREYVTHSGHVVRAHTRLGYSPEQPYLRPALYRRRYG